MRAREPTPDRCATCRARVLHREPPPTLGLPRRRPTRARLRGCGPEPHRLRETPRRRSARNPSRLTPQRAVVLDIHVPEAGAAMRRPQRVKHRAFGEQGLELLGIEPVEDGLQCRAHSRHQPDLMRLQVDQRIAQRRRATEEAARRRLQQQLQGHGGVGREFQRVVTTHLDHGHLRLHFVLGQGAHRDQTVNPADCDPHHRADVGEELRRRSIRERRVDPGAIKKAAPQRLRARQRLRGSGRLAGNRRNLARRTGCRRGRLRRRCRRGGCGTALELVPLRDHARPRRMVALVSSCSKAACSV